MEITLNKVMAFDTGFIIESQSQLLVGMIYYLYIDSLEKLYYIFKSGTVIIDSWSNVGYTPIDNSQVCFTLNDTPSMCPPINCTLTINKGI